MRQGSLLGGNTQGVGRGHHSTPRVPLPGPLPLTAEGSRPHIRPAPRDGVPMDQATSTQWNPFYFGLTGSCHLLASAGPLHCPPPAERPAPTHFPPLFQAHQPLLQAVPSQDSGLLVARAFGSCVCHDPPLFYTLASPSPRAAPGFPGHRGQHMLLDGPRPFIVSAPPNPSVQRDWLQAQLLQPLLGQGPSSWASPPAPLPRPTAPSTPLAAPPVPLTQAQASRRPPPSVALPPTAQPHCLSKAAHEEAKHKHRSARGTAAVDASGTHKDKLARPSQPAPRMASTPLFAGGTSRRLQGETAPPPQTF